jgi:starvation-inducible DNA-binding protein
MPTKKSTNGATKPTFTIPGMDARADARTAELLQERLTALLDLSLVLKHVHWNVVGPTFIGVHQMLDPQVDAVRDMVDETAERIAALGAAPNGNAGALVAARTWDDYDLLRASVMEHLGALDTVYSGVIASHRAAIDELEDLDLVSQDMLIGQAHALEQAHWFVRAHLEAADGTLVTGDARTERGAARRARTRTLEPAARRR